MITQCQQEERNNSFSGHVWCRKNNKVIGPYGEKDFNDNGERMIELFHQYSLHIQNGVCKNKDIHRYTDIYGCSQLNSTQNQ